MGGIRRTTQILASLLCTLAVVAAGSLVFPIPYVSDYVRQNIITSDNASLEVIVFLVLLGFIFLMILLYSLFAPSKKSYLILETEKGNIVVKGEVIEATAYNAIRSNPNIKRPHVSAKFGKDVEHIKMKIDFDILETEDITRAGNEVQCVAKKDVDALLGAEIPKINVKVRELSSEDESQQKQVVSGPRVR